MRVHLILATSLLLSTSVVLAQSVGINADGVAPHPSAMLDVNHPNKGLLIPRVALTGTTDVVTVVSPATSLLVYNTANITGTNAVQPGFYYWNGTAWVNFAGSSSSAMGGWSLTGNSGIDPNTQFIGTTDNQPLIFKVNNQLAGIIQGYNTAIGLNALQSNTTGYRNTASGQAALQNNTTGFYNSAFGHNGLYSNTSGTFNAANGADALHSNTTGGSNTASGWGTLYFNTTGNSNTASGAVALYSNTTGNSNTASGQNALYSNTTGSANTASGFTALQSNTMGNYNSAYGVNALNSNTTGNGNSAIGQGALYSNTTGLVNTASGQNALYANTTGVGNTASGFAALASNATGGFNTASGTEALYSNTTGDNNMASGQQALYSNNTGSDNVGIGKDALYHSTGGSMNAAVGRGALSNNQSGNLNTGLGYNANLSGPTLSNATAVGANSVVGCSNCLVLGNNANVGIRENSPSFPLTFDTNTGDKISFFGNSGAHYGIGIQANTLQLHTDGASSNIAFGYGSSGSFNQTFIVRGDGSAQLLGALNQSSDRRLKKDITRINRALHKVLLLHGYNYNWKDAKADQTLQTGIIAQEVERVMPELVKKDDKGMMSVNYQGLIPYLIESIKAQQLTINKQGTLDNDLKKENEMLKLKVAALETSFNDKLTSLAKAFKQMQDVVQKQMEQNKSGTSR